MSRKRSLKERYIRFLRRIWPAPTLAAFVLSLGACTSRPATSASAQTHSAPAVMAAGDDVYDDWGPELLPTELYLAPEFRSACAPVVALPPSLLLDEKDELLDALEPIASCLTLGPLAHQRLDLFGSSELPGRWVAPIDGSGRADRLRSTLTLLGVPFGDIETHDVDNWNQVELGMTPGSS